MSPHNYDRPPPAARVDGIAVTFSWEDAGRMATKSCDPDCRAIECSVARTIATALEEHGTPPSPAKPDDETMVAVKIPLAAMRDAFDPASPSDEHWGEMSIMNAAAMAYRAALEEER